MSNVDAVAAIPIDASDHPLEQFLEHGGTSPAAPPHDGGSQ